MNVCRVEDFVLETTLESGQFFRWTRSGNGYLVQTAGHLFWVAQRGDELFFEGADEPAVARFFSWDHDLKRITETFMPSLGGIVRPYRGLRLIRQDPWECLVSFILSAASNIPRITRNLRDISSHLGAPLSWNGTVCHALPPPSELADARRIRRLRLGFRSRYLSAAARLVDQGILRGLEELSTGEARARLMEIPGVGRKVADCVLLFAYGRLESFPVDTWIRKIMTRLYFRGRRVPDRRIIARAQERFGPFAGYAQQYLYMYARHERRAVGLP